MYQLFGNSTDYEIISPDIVGAEVSEDIVITKKAMDVLVNEFYENYFYFDSNSQTKKTDYFIRLAISSSASYAKRYSIEFENKLGTFDKVFELGKINIVIDRKDIFYYMGVVIDYVENEDDKMSGFVFIDNSEYFFHSEEEKEEEEEEIEEVTEANEINEIYEVDDFL